MKINSILSLEPAPRGSNLHMAREIYSQTSKKTKYCEMKSTTGDTIRHLHALLNE